MNLIVLERSDFVDTGEVVLTGARSRHLREVLDVYPGLCLRAGLIDDVSGSLVVTEIVGEEIRARVHLDQPPPKRPDFDLIVAMPRPRVLGRVIEQTTAMGVGTIVIVNAWRVRRSYFQSPELADESLNGHVRAGIAQCGVTSAPRISIEPLFRPFIEDRAPALLTDATGIVLDPSSDVHLAESALPTIGRIVVAIGPEGGWSDFERESFVAAGFHVASLGARIQRVETACVQSLSLLDAARRRTSTPESR